MELQKRNYFSKSDMIAWINTTFNKEIRALEELSDGIVLAEMLNRFTPSTMSLKDLNMKPKGSWDSLANLKQVEKALKKLKLGIDFKIEKIAKKSFHDIWQACNDFKDLLENTMTKPKPPLPDTISAEKDSAKKSLSKSASLGSGFSVKRINSADSQNGGKLRKQIGSGNQTKLAKLAEKEKIYRRIILEESLNNEEKVERMRKVLMEEECEGITEAPL